MLLTPTSRWKRSTNAGHSFSACHGTPCYGYRKRFTSSPCEMSLFGMTCRYELVLISYFTFKSHLEFRLKILLFHEQLEGWASLPFQRLCRRVVRIPCLSQWYVCSDAWRACPWKRSLCWIMMSAFRSQMLILCLGFPERGRDNPHIFLDLLVLHRCFGVNKRLSAVSHQHRIHMLGFHFLCFSSDMFAPGIVSPELFTAQGTPTNEET